MNPSMPIALLADIYQEKFGKDLLQAMIRWMAQNFQQIREEREFCALSKETILRVLEEQKRLEDLPKKRKYFMFI